MISAALALVLHAAVAEERLDHRGAVGLLLAVSGQNKVANNPFEVGWRFAVDVGGTINIGYSSNELVLVGRATFGAPHVGSPLAGTDTCDPTKNPTPPPVSQCVLDDHRLHEVDTQIYTGYRGYFGDRWKTFFDLELAVHFTPYLTVGPRFAVGLQYELSPVAGLFTQLAANLGFGEVLQFKAELLIGVQLRSFLLE